MDGTGTLFTPFIEALPADLRVHVIAYPVTLADPALLVDFVQRHLPTEGPYLLVAESFSGAIALQVAERSPAGLRGVVLCATFIENPVPWFPRPFAPLVRGPWFAWAPSAVVSAMLMGWRTTREQRTRLRLALAAVPPKVLAERARVCLTADARGSLEACPVPLLVLRAMEDRVVAKRCADAICAVRPDAELREIRAPHLLLQQAPREAWAAIQSFVQVSGRWGVDVVSAEHPP